MCAQVFRARTPQEAMELVARLLEYTPSLRMTPLSACAHTFFDELREQGTRLPNGRELPPLFNFTEHELRIQPALNPLLIPKYMQPADGSQTSTGVTANQANTFGATVAKATAAGVIAGSSSANEAAGSQAANSATGNEAASQPIAQNTADPNQSNMS